MSYSRTTMTANLAVTPGTKLNWDSVYLPVGISLHQGATVHRDRDILHAVVLFVIRADLKGRQNETHRSPQHVSITQGKQGHRSVCVITHQTDFIADFIGIWF